jgi:hypothetical protein
MQQLDIFADSRDVTLRNDVLEQLQRRDAAAACTALDRLAREYPDDGALSAMTVLVQELGSGPGAPFADHAALDGARRHLENEVLPRTPPGVPCTDRAVMDCTVLEIACAAERVTGPSQQRCRQPCHTAMASGRRLGGSWPGGRGHRRVVAHPGTARVDDRGALSHGWAGCHVAAACRAGMAGAGTVCGVAVRAGRR